MIPWLYSFAAFTVFRFFAFLFFSIVNDLIFAYNIMICLLWILFISFSVYGWLIVYSLYIELSDLTRLEDLAHLRVRIIQMRCYFKRSEVESDRKSNEKCPYYFVSDRYYAIAKRIDDTFHRWLQTYNTAQHGIDDAGQLIVGVLSYYWEVRSLDRMHLLRIRILTEAQTSIPSKYTYIYTQYHIEMYKQLILGSALLCRQ